jgi:L-rhamnonate dehydratase
MKIEQVILRRLSGAVPTDGPFWEDRVLQPVDHYPDQAALLRPELAGQVDDVTYRVTWCFLEITTAEGVAGTAGPLDETVAYFIARQLRPLLVGQDALATERVWDVLHRTLVHGRQGTPMLAVSAVDCALWALKGRWLGQPVHRLLGGPTREEVPAYASMLGFAVDDLDLVRDRARWARDQGYRGQKWFLRYGPASGEEGFRRNVATVQTLREALGDDDLMLDCWQGWDLAYTLRMADAIAELRPRWLEECVMADRVETYAEIRARTHIPIAGGEHEYTRWGFRRFLDANALDVLQPDIYWAGGMAEVLKIAALATAHDRMVVPHGSSSAAGLHFSALQSPAHTPVQEHLVKWDQLYQCFFAEPIEPVHGRFSINERPGLGVDLAPEKAERVEVVFPAA